MSSNILLKAEGLKKYFTVKSSYSAAKTVKAVDDVSFHINEGETFGLVGETACGKSTLGRTLIRLHEPTAGSISYRGTDITKGNMRPLRRKLQIIFQDPGGSMDPQMKVGGLIEEVLRTHKIGEDKKERLEIAREHLEKVGLKGDSIDRYPSEFSGGEQQRISIARSLVLKPEFIVCDEPTSALDVSIQSQIVNLLEDMQAKLNLTYLFISHNLPVVRHISDRIGVMYLGKIIEMGDAKEICAKPAHPYTSALMSAVPIPDPRSSRKELRKNLKGDIWNAGSVPTGCRFHLRCPYATERCRMEEPTMKECAPGHYCACWLNEK